MNTTQRTGLLLVLLAVLGCEQPRSNEYSFVVRVESRPGRAVANAQVMVRGSSLGETNEEGSFTANVDGTEGEVLPIEVQCPAGHRAPQRTLFVPLRRLLDEVALPEFVVTCVHTTRSVVVALRAEGGPHLPVLFLGRELSRTDESGAAHLMLDVAPDDVIELSLDTRGQPDLRPVSPVLHVETGTGDDLLAVSQVFTRIQHKETAAPKRRGPVRIQ